MAKQNVSDPVLDQKFKELDRKNQEALLGGGEKRIEQQHAKGKLTARERVHLLMDEGSFEELGKFVMHRSKDFGLDKAKNTT
jgi:propionyl-CoA carboxylase beta chain